MIVRISPRKQSQYRFQAGYTPKPWAVLGGSINIFQQSNGDSAVNYQGHNRNYGLTASLAPNERFALDLAYNYNDVMQNALICFNDTPPPGVSLPFVNNAASCAANDPSNPLLADSYYATHQLRDVHRPFQTLKRLTLNLGGGITRRRRQHAAIQHPATPRIFAVPLLPARSQFQRRFDPWASLEQRLELLPVQRTFICRTDGASLFSCQHRHRVPPLLLLTLGRIDSLPARACHQNHMHDH